MDRFQREFGSQFGEQGGFGSQIEHDNAIVGQNDGVADIPVEGGDEVCIIFFFCSIKIVDFCSITFLFCSIFIVML